MPGATQPTLPRPCSPDGQGVRDTLADSPPDASEAVYARRLTLAMPLLMVCFPELAWLCEAARMARAVCIMRQLAKNVVPAAQASAARARERIQEQVDKDLASARVSTHSNARDALQDLLRQTHSASFGEVEGCTNALRRALPGLPVTLRGHVERWLQAHFTQGARGGSSQDALVSMIAECMMGTARQQVAANAAAAHSNLTTQLQEIEQQVRSMVLTCWTSNMHAC